jgi:hypothetical protein
MPDRRSMTLNDLSPIILALSLLADEPAGCPGAAPAPAPPAGDDRPAGPCDDGTDAPDDPPPACGAPEQLAVLEGQWACVRPSTCTPASALDCQRDRDCAASERCDPCGAHRCPGCTACVPGCVEHGCASEVDLVCEVRRPDCPAGEAAVVHEGCWTCVRYDDCRRDGG